MKQSFTCRWCLNPVEQEPRSAADLIRLRAVLMIPDSAPDPPICDGCYESAIGSFNPRSANAGTRNDGQSNLLLRALAG